MSNWNRRPQVKRKFDNNVVHSPPNEWQQWLRAGVLCEAKVNLFATTFEEKGVMTTFADRYRPAASAVLKKGEVCVCLGELNRRKFKPQPGSTVKQVESTWFFLCPSGIFAIDPSSLVESETQDEA